MSEIPSAPKPVEQANAPESKTFKRRDFIKSAASAAFAFQIVPRHVLGGPNFVAPSEKVNVALVGAGGQGLQNVKALFQLPDVQIIAVADPAESFSLEKYYYGGHGGRLPSKEIIEKHYSQTTPNHQVAQYEDFRKMLDENKDVDAVLCATPDHLHAYVSILSMRAGKHVYCEKPLAHNIWETREIAKVAKETGLATQLGSQGHSSVGTRETAEAIKTGVIGAIREAHVWVGTQRWNPGLTGYPTDKPELPKGLNWDLWIGPRSERAYHPALHPVAWRDFWEYGTTGIGDFGCHDLNNVIRALGLDLPSVVEAFPGGPMNEEIAPTSSLIHYLFPNSIDGKPVQLTWYDGGLRPARPLALDNFPLPSRGCMFIGEKGIIQCDGNGGPPRIFPQQVRMDFKKPEPTLKRSNGHHRDWIDACKGGEPATSPFDYASRLTEIVLLGVLSLRAQRRIEWDAEQMKPKSGDDLTPLIKEPVRPGWEV